MRANLGFAVLAAGTALLYAAGVEYGRVVVDEGIYAYCARLVSLGAAPYRDFFFWQPPLILQVYARAGGAVGFSLLPLRCVSSALALAALALLALAARRRSGAAGAAIVLVLLGLNLPYVYATSGLKTQPLSIFLYAGALACFELPSAPALRWGLAPALLGLAAASRLSLLPLLPLSWLYVYAASGRSLKAAASAAAAGTGVFLAAMVPALLGDPERARFGLWDYYGLIRMDFSWPRLWVEYLTPVLRDGLPCFVLLGAWLRRFARGAASADPWEGFLLGSYAAVAAVHAASPVKYPVHQQTNLPFLALFLATVFGRRPRPGFRPVLGALAVAGALACPRDEFPVGAVDGRRPVDAVTAVADGLRAQIPAGSVIYAGDPSIAVQGGLRLLDGADLGFLSHLGAYGLSTADCLRYGGVDNAILAGAFARGAPAAVLLQPWDVTMMKRDRSGVSFDELLTALKSRYVKSGTYLGVGQFHQRLDVWTRREPQASSAASSAKPSSVRRRPRTKLAGSKLSSTGPSPGSTTQPK